MNIEQLDSKLFPTGCGTTSERRISSQDAGDSAEAFLRRNGSTGEASQSSISGKTELIEWAKANGRLITKLPFKLDGPRDLGGGEHHVFADKVSGRFIKITKGNGDKFGITLDLRGKKWGIGRASALQYLVRIRLSNQFTGDDIRVHAVFVDKFQNVNIVTSQPDVEGDLPAVGTIKAYMEAAKFVSIGESAFYRESDNLLILDLHDLNANAVGDEIIIFDASILQPTPEQIEALRQQSVVLSDLKTKISLASTREPHHF